MNAKERCRRASQILIEQIGAPGPENVVETAERAVIVITSLRARLESARDLLEDAVGQLDPSFTSVDQDELREFIREWLKEIELR